MPYVTNISLNQYPDYYLARQKLIADELASLYNTQKQYIPFTGGRIAVLDPSLLKSENLSKKNIGSEKPFHQSSINYAKGFSKPNYSGIQQYQDSYNRKVSDLIEKKGESNLKDNIVPFIDRAIIGDYDYNGLRNKSWNDRAIKSALNEIKAQKSIFSYKGYEHAAQQSAMDRMRLLDASKLSAGLGSMQHASALSDIGALENVAQRNQGYAQQKLDLANQDQRRQEEYPWMNLERMGAILNNMPMPQTQSQQINVTPPEMRVNTAGNIASMAGQLAGAGMSMFNSPGNNYAGYGGRWK